MPSLSGALYRNALSTLFGGAPPCATNLMSSGTVYIVSRVLIGLASARPANSNDAIPPIIANISRRLMLAPAIKTLLVYSPGRPSCRATRVLLAAGRATTIDQVFSDSRRGGQVTSMPLRGDVLSRGAKERRRTGLASLHLMSRLAWIHVGVPNHQVHDLVAVGLLDHPLSRHL